MNRKKYLAVAIVTAIMVPVYAVAQNAAPSESQKTTNLQTVTVTGSLIPRAEIETVTPTMQITADDIRTQGFKTVADALRASSVATGSVQGSQTGGSFTQGAQAISLFGLDPGFTKILVDGHPLANYPLLYNGQSNFTDISNIPTAMVERIDIVPGNQSAVYGSDAIAGVINIILKKNMEGVDVNFRGGGYTGGGGGNQRLQLTGGRAFGDLKTLFSVELSNQQPIWAYDRKLTRSSESDPTRTGAPIASRNFLRAVLDPNTGRTTYVDPVNGAASCAPLANLFAGSTYYASRPGLGNYCGSNDSGYATLMNRQRAANGYFSSSYKLNDNVEFYGNGLYSANNTQSNAGSRFTFWSANNNSYFMDKGTGQITLAQHAMAPEEVGGYDVINNVNIGHQYQAVLGARGRLGESSWDYDAYYNRSASVVVNKQLRPLGSPYDALFEQQFLGPQLGVDDVYGLPIYNPDWQSFYKPLTPEQYRGTLGQVNSRSQTWTQDLNLQLTNTELFELPAGPVGFAAVAQAGNEHWSNPTDVRVVNGDFWGLSGTQGNGKRQHYAVASELNVPITSMLIASAAARYDRYRWAGAAVGKPTYKLGLEFRPIEPLLIRANYATAFRAPDMAYLFAGDSGYFTGAPDYYACEKYYPGEPLRDCPYYGQSVPGQRAGNRDLKPITAKSWGLGAVWSPSPDFSLSADYLRIKISNEVNDINVDTLFANERDCRNGSLDASSPTCVDALARIQRDANDQITLIKTSPINISGETVDAVTAGANYRIDAGRAGKFTLNGAYSNTLRHDYRQYPGDPTIRLLSSPGYASDFKTNFNGSIGWALNKWSATLYGIRYGASPNYAAMVAGNYGADDARHLPAWVLYNASVSYQLPDDASVSFIVNNIRNTAPPRDRTYSAWPYYNTSNYNVFGRAVFVEFNWHFGEKKS